MAQKRAEWRRSSHIQASSRKKKRSNTNKSKQPTRGRREEEREGRERGEERPALHWCAAMNTHMQSLTEPTEQSSTEEGRCNYVDDIHLMMTFP